MAKKEDEKRPVFSHSGAVLRYSGTLGYGKKVTIVQQNFLHSCHGGVGLEKKYNFCSHSNHSTWPFTVAEVYCTTLLDSDREKHTYLFSLLKLHLLDFVLKIQCKEWWNDWTKVLFPPPPSPLSFLPSVDAEGATGLKEVGKKPFLQIVHVPQGFSFLLLSWWSCENTSQSWQHKVAMPIAQFLGYYFFFAINKYLLCLIVVLCCLSCRNGINLRLFPL